MNESFEGRVNRAGRVDLDDAAIAQALATVVHETRPGEPHRSVRRFAPAIALGAVLALAAPVAVAATQWGPWTFVADPDLVVARDWTDVGGTPLGSCETRLAIDELPDDVQADVAAYFATLDVDAIEPNAEAVAAGLNSVGRLDEIGRLVEGAEPSDFTVSHQGELLDPTVNTDARILQDSLVQTITTDLATAMFASHGDALSAGLGSAGETQCTAAPGTQQP